MAQATLIDPQGKKVVVDSGSPQASQYFTQGFKLMGADGKPVADNVAPMGTSLPPGMTQLTSPSQIPGTDIKGQVGSTNTPGSFLYGTPKPTPEQAPLGGAGVAGAAGAGGAPAAGGAAGSNTAFGMAFGQLMAKAQQNQGLQDKKNALLQHLYSTPLTPEQLRTLSPSQQAAIQSGDKSLLEFQIMSINDAITGRANENTKALDYMMTGYKEDQAAAKAAQAEIDKKRDDARTTMLGLIDKYGDISGLGVEALARIQQTGEIQPQDAIKLTQSLKMQQAEHQVVKGTKTQAGGYFDSTTGKFVATGGGGGGGAGGGAGGGKTGGGYVSGFSPDAIAQMADVYNRTQTMPSLGVAAASLPLKAAIINKAAELQMASNGAIDPVLAKAQLKANTTALTDITKRMANINALESSADKAMDIILEKSKKVYRTGSPWINKKFQAVQEQGMGDPDVTALKNAVVEGMTEYGRVIAGATGAGGLSDSARNEAESLINAAQTPEQLKSAIETSRQIMKARVEGMQTEKDMLVSNIAKVKDAPTGAVPSVEDAKKKYNITY